MTYSVSAISSVNEIPALLKSFADTLGYTTTTVSGTSVTVKHPTYTPAKVFTVSALITGSAATLRHQIAVACSAAGATTAIAESPKMNPSGVDSAGSVVVSLPTKIHLFGKLAGGASDPAESFIAGVIEYGFNLYRHFYLGYIEKVTAFDGGELTTGSAFQPVGRPAQTVSYMDNDDTIYPFSANTNVNGDAGNGGAYIDHVGNAVPWRLFSSAASTGSQTLDTFLATYGGSMILGGIKDSINTGYLACGKSPYAAAQMMAPVNLYIGKRIAGAQYFQAVGRVAGARMVNMEDLEPGVEVAVGTQLWRVFPVFAKSAVKSTAYTIYTTANGFPAMNTSYYLGMAYKVSD